MTAHITHGARWSTACEGDDGCTGPAQLDALGEHLHLCAHQKGFWSALDGAVRATTGYAAGHVITSLLGLLALATLTSLLLA